MIYKKQRGHLMKSKTILRDLSELMAETYDKIVLCPLDDERNLLLSAGEKDAETFFESCQQVFGLNMIRAFHEACIYVSGYCDFLHDTFDDYIADSNAELYICYAGELVDAIEFLCEHAPIDAYDEKAMLSNRAGCARFFHNGLKQRYQTYRKACK